MKYNSSSINAAIITKYPFDLKTLKKRKRITLHEDFYDEFPSALLSMKELTYLDLSNTFIVDIPKEINQLNLNVLVLSQKTQTIPDSVKDLYLDTLDLSHTAITTLSAALPNVKNVILPSTLVTFPKKIKVSSNLALLPQQIRSKVEKEAVEGILNTRALMVTNISDNIDLYINLTSLHITGSVTIVPTAFFTLVTLEKLKIDFIDTSVPERIRELTQLKELEFGEGLDVFPEAILQIKGLQVLRLGKTRIKKLPREIKQLQNLEEFSITMNDMVDVPDEFFELASLKIITLYINPDAVLSRKWQQFVNLQELQLITDSDKNFIDTRKEYDFYLSKLRLTGRSYPFMKHPLFMEELNINDDDYTPENYEKITDMLNLKKLKINFEQVYNDGVDDRISKLTKLEELELVGIRQIAREALVGLLKLRKLIISHYFWVSAEDNNILVPPNIETLLLDGKLVANLLVLNKLTSLTINHGYLFSLPNEFATTLIQLKELVIDGNIRELPNNIGNLVNLEILDIRLESTLSTFVLPNSISSLVKLQKFRFISIRTDVENMDFIYKLVNLEELHLNIPDGSISNDIANLTNLKTLTWNNAGNIEFPKGIMSLQKLESLSLFQSKIEILPDFTGKLKTLKKLGIHLTRSTTDVLDIKGLPNLEILKVYSGDFITSLSENTMNHLKLKVLQLYGNNINILPISINKLTSLEYLDLSNNAFDILPSMKNLVSLKYLNVSQNLLASLPILPHKFYEESKRIKFKRESYIKYSNNPVHYKYYIDDIVFLGDTTQTAEQAKTKYIWMREYYKTLFS